MASYYSNHRDHLLVAIEKERHEIDRIDDKMNEAHRAHCRIIYQRLVAELDDYDEAIRVAAAAVRAKKPIEIVELDDYDEAIWVAAATVKQPVEIVDVGPPEVEL